MLSQHVKKVFYFEVGLNIIAILMMSFAPDSFLIGMGIAGPTPVGRILLLWFVALTVALTYILGGVLWSGDERALRIVLEGYLFGDLVYLFALFQLIQALGNRWTALSAFTFGITIFFALARIVYMRTR